jgi:hypothetical protein
MGEHLPQLARLRAAVATGQLPRDLGVWVLDLVEELEPVAERVERRNRLLRAAAGRLSGSRWARAGRLEAEVEALDGPRLSMRAVEADDGVRELVARALEADPGMPRSRRQLFRLLRED